MSLTLENPHANAAQRSVSAGPPQKRKGKALPQGKTALSMKLAPMQMEWLAEYATSQYESYHAALNGWRTKIKRFEKIAEADRTSRKGYPNPNETSAPDSIFNHSNRSLGVVSGFADFAFAQARDDLFGTTPWFSASPEGLADEKLATAITRHAHWKFGQTSLQSCLIDSIKHACELGTGFPKLTWRREIESYASVKKVLLDDAGAPVIKPDGSYATSDDLPAEARDLAPTEEMLVEDQTTVFDNLEARCIDYQDIAFDPTAPELDLKHTDVFHRFQIGLLDAKQIYGLTDEQYQAALSLLNSDQDGAHTPREHRSESTPINSTHQHEENANPPILLVEGYLRCNPFSTTAGPTRIWCVFSPLLKTILTTDYLVNQTPGGLLPIYSIPWFKVPNRVVGKGYFERFEDVENFIDEQYNLVIYRDRLAANPVVGWDESQFDEDFEGETLVLSPDKKYKLKPNAKISDGIQAVTVPDANHRSVDLINMMMQVAQLRTGITSASQGELSGVPEVNTATGINQIISRGATLLKWPIDECKYALAKPLEGAVCMLYANHDADETFTWAEGKEPELMTLPRDDVRGLKINVRLTMTQSQNQQKLQSGQAAIGIHQAYIALPEPEKQAARPLYVQTVGSLGFHGADQIIREPVVDPMGVAALLPPELGQAFMAFAQQMGLIAPEAPTGEEAGPPSEPAPPLPQ